MMNYECHQSKPFDKPGGDAPYFNNDFSVTLSFNLRTSTELHIWGRTTARFFTIGT
jgi:hypothetical protein